jgi:hypothetical protein
MASSMTGSYDAPTIAWKWRRSKGLALRLQA